MSRDVATDRQGADRHSPDRRPRVFVVGGGLAGLSAAEALAKLYGNDLAIVLHEAKRSVGGRASSFDDPRTGQSVDYCQHVAMGCCTNLIGLLKRSDQLQHWDRSTDLEFRHPDFPPSHFAASQTLPPPLHLVKALGGIRYLSPRQKLRIVRGVWRLMRTPSVRLRDITASDWLIRNGQDDEICKRFWDVILVSALGENTQFVSMDAARKVMIDGFAGARGASDVLVPRQPLSELFGVRLRQTLTDLGVLVHTHSAVESMSIRQDGRIDVNCGTSVRETGDPDVADHVIVATAWHHSAPLLAGHLPTTLTETFATFPSSAISGVHLWFDREISQRSHTVLVGTRSQWLFRRRDPNASEAYYQVVISASSDTRGMSKDDLVAEVTKELKQLFPDAHGAKLLRSRVVTDPRSVFSVRPEVDSARPSASTALPWLHLAGDWTSTGWPATMEGAVISGRLAAASVAAQLQLGSVSIDPGLPRGWLANLIIRP